MLKISVVIPIYNAKKYIEADNFKMAKELMDVIEQIKE